jgi:hypothetical protein
MQKANFFRLGFGNYTLERMSNFSPPSLLNVSKIQPRQEAGLQSH